MKAALDPTELGDVGVPAGGELVRFATAAHRRRQDAGGRDADEAERQLTSARTALEAAVGADGVTEAAATVAIFNGLVRIADGTGIELDAGVLADSADFRSATGVDRFAGAANTVRSSRPPSRAVSDRPVAESSDSVRDLFR